MKFPLVCIVLAGYLAAVGTAFAQHGIESGVPTKAPEVIKHGTGANGGGAQIFGLSAGEKKQAEEPRENKTVSNDQKTGVNRSGVVGGVMKGPANSSSASVTDLETANK